MLRMLVSSFVGIKLAHHGVDVGKSGLNHTVIFLSQKLFSIYNLTIFTLNCCYQSLFI